MFLLSHEESRNHHRSNYVASEVKDKNITFLLKALTTGQVFFCLLFCFFGFFCVCFFFIFPQVFSSNCNKKLFSIPFVCLLLGFKVSFTRGWLESGKLFCTDHGKTNSSKEGERIKILFIREESWPHCPELLGCLNGLTCWCQGELCVDWSCSELAVLSCLCFGSAARERRCSPERKEVTEVNYFWPVIK